MKKFTNETLFEIIIYLKEVLKTSKIIEFEVINPDLNDDLHAGSLIEFEEDTYIYRSYKAWLDLAELLYCKILTPKVISSHTISLSFKKLDILDSFHNNKIQKEERYGTNSSFFHINKNEEPAFLWAYLDALNNIDINNCKTILNLGINKADEFEVIKKLLSKDEFEKKDYYGIDFSSSAISLAKERFPSSNFHFICEDLNNLEHLSLPKADLLISVGTLQSSSLNFKPYFTSLVQNYLEKGASIILGFPNTRWLNGEMIYGAKVKNYSDSELSLLFKDVHFCKKYLQQKNYRVKITGKNYIFLSAYKINS